jgi:AraC-like DNA-binding protein
LYAGALEADRHVERARRDEWVRYWRLAGGRVEAMHAHFRSHTYHRHSHETYSFGVTESGAQSFACRGGRHTSAAGMIMAFNPDDPHDGHSSDERGFTYVMVHIDPDVVAEVVTEGAARTGGLPLFADPVIHDPAVAGALRRLQRALAGGTALERDEQLTAAVLALVRTGSTRPLLGDAPRSTTSDTTGIAGRVRAVLEERYAGDLRAEDIAAAAGRSRFAAYRAFKAAYGLAPSEYQRQLRLRAARRLLARGEHLAEVAADVGFADQAHLTRWFVRSFGLTPGSYRRAVGAA